MVRRLKKDAEAAEIQRVMSITDWNCKLAAAHLGISYKALLYKIKQYGISILAVREFRASPEQNAQLETEEGRLSEA